MELERSGSVRIDNNLYDNRKGCTVEAMSITINIPKKAFVQSWKIVKENQGNYGIEKQSISDFESDLSSHLYFLLFPPFLLFLPGVKRVDIPKGCGNR